MKILNSADSNWDNQWNKLVWVTWKTTTSTSKKVREVLASEVNHAHLLLRQMNTAAGQTMLKEEVANFLSHIKIPKLK